MRELNSESGLRFEISPVPASGTRPNLSDLAAITAKHDDFVPFLNGLNELGQARFRLVHVDSDHVS